MNMPSQPGGQGSSRAQTPGPQNRHPKVRRKSQGSAEALPSRTGPGTPEESSPPGHACAGLWPVTLWSRRDDSETRRERRPLPGRTLCDDWYRHSRPSRGPGGTPIGSGWRDCARHPSHTTGHAVFSIRRL